MHISLGTSVDLFLLLGNIVGQNVNMAESYASIRTGGGMGEGAEGSGMRDIGVSVWTRNGIGNCVAEDQRGGTQRGER